MAENTDEKIGKIHDTVTGIRLEFEGMRGEQKATNKSVDTLCKSLDTYSKGTEKRLSNIESDLGNRTPDDPAVFSQIQALQAFRRRVTTNGKAIWAFLASLILLGISQIAGFFGKGN